MRKNLLLLSLLLAAVLLSGCGQPSAYEQYQAAVAQLRESPGASWTGFEYSTVSGAEELTVRTEISTGYRLCRTDEGWQMTAERSETSWAPDYQPPAGEETVLSWQADGRHLESALYYRQGWLYQTGSAAGNCRQALTEEELWQLISRGLLDFPAALIAEQSAEPDAEGGTLLTFRLDSEAYYAWNRPDTDETPAATANRGQPLIYYVTLDSGGRIAATSFSQNLLRAEGTLCERQIGLGYISYDYPELDFPPLPAEDFPLAQP